MRWIEVYVRCVVAAAAVGVVVGGGIGTGYMPVVGTAWGAFFGGFCGTFFGLVQGLVLATLTRWLRPDTLLMRIFGAVSAAGAGWIVAAGFHLPLWWPIALAAVMGVVLGPLVAFGMEDGTWERWWRVALGIVVAGGGIGGTVGLVIGLRYPLTAPVAVVEGGFFGVGCGIVGAVLISLVWLPLIAARSAR